MYLDTLKYILSITYIPLNVTNAMSFDAEVDRTLPGEVRYRVDFFVRHFHAQAILMMCYILGLKGMSVRYESRRLTK